MAQFNKNKYGASPANKMKSLCGGASVIEYIVLLMIILGGLYVMKDTISRGLFSKYKQTGDSFAFGRQYDAKRTSVCKEDTVKFNPDGSPAEKIIYDEDCYQARVHRSVAEGGCSQCYPGEKACFACEDAVKRTCQNDYCNQ